MSQGFDTPTGVGEAGEPVPRAQFERLPLAAQLLLASRCLIRAAGGSWQPGTFPMLPAEFSELTSQTCYVAGITLWSVGASADGLESWRNDRARTATAGAMAIASEGAMRWLMLLGAPFLASPTVRTMRATHHAMRACTTGKGTRAGGAAAHATELPGWLYEITAVVARTFGLEVWILGEMVAFDGLGLAAHEVIGEPRSLLDNLGLVNSARYSFPPPWMTERRFDADPRDSKGVGRLAMVLAWRWASLAEQAGAASLFQGMQEAGELLAGVTEYYQAAPPPDESEEEAELEMEAEADGLFDLDERDEEIEGPPSPASPSPAPPSRPDAPGGLWPMAPSAPRKEPEKQARDSSPPVAADGGAPPRGPVVNTGFAAHDDPAAVVPKDRSLVANRDYFFWLDVGAYTRASIERRPTGLPTEKLPERARLGVVLFSFPDGIKLIAGSDEGEIELQPDGSAMVIRQSGTAPGAAPGVDPNRRLYFRVRTPKRPGDARLRCSIYHGNVLVQSRLVRASVARGQSGPGTLTSELDYTISTSLRADQLASLGVHDLSIMLNGDGDAGAGDRTATHQFRFHGATDFRSDVSISDSQLATLITKARKTLRRTAWGTSEPWDGRLDRYRYAARATQTQFANDVFELARVGFRFWFTVWRRLESGAPRAGEGLADVIRAPGVIQFASTRSAREFFPVSIVYDHPLDTQEENLRLCPAFLTVYANGAEAIAASECFQGRCPSYADGTIVCPSGFWGYRHAIGIPVALNPTEADTPADVSASLGCTGDVAFISPQCTDAQFIRREEHEARLRALSSRIQLDPIRTRDDTLSRLRKGGFHIAYFFCHAGVGGQDRDTPYILVGPLDGKRIVADNLADVRWAAPRPLVFINGCNTAALDPAGVFEFVSAFVEHAGASGVLGSETTVFEPLACDFAEAFFRSFILRGRTLGESVRAARHELLATLNPLGLTYLPFALSTLRLNA